MKKDLAPVCHSTARFHTAAVATLALLFTSGFVDAQNRPPAATRVEDDLTQDAGRDYYMRGKLLYDDAQKSTDREGRVIQFQRAAEILSDYLKSFPNHANAQPAWLYLGYSYYQGGQIEEGKRCFNTLLNQYGDSVYAAAAAYTLATDYYNKGQYALAAPLFERYALRALKPEDAPRGYYFVGNCFRALKQDRKAAANYLKVSENPLGGLYTLQANVALGELAIESGKNQDALNYFQAVLAKTTVPTDLRGEALLGASRASTKLGQQDASQNFLQQILQAPGMEKYRPEAQIALMQIFFVNKEYAKVIDAYKRSSVKAEGTDEAARLMLAAKAYRQLKQPNEALTIFRAIEKTVPPQNELAFQAAYYRLLCFYEVEGSQVPEQVDGFIEIYGKARSDDERIHTALLMKAGVLYSAKQNAAAMKTFAKINQQKLSEENRKTFLYQSGWCFTDNGDPATGARALGDFIAAYPNDPRIRAAMAKRAKAYVDNSEQAKAILEFDKLTSQGEKDEFASFARLESARVRRAQGNISDMIVRYKLLLTSEKNLSDKLQGEANYWVGWGLVKNNVAKESISYLEKARKLSAEIYRKHAGILLALGYFTSQDASKLTDEINLAIVWKYQDDIPSQAVQWAGMQRYNTGDFASAEKFLTLVSNPQEPRETPKEVWRYLAKARLETNNPEGALIAAKNVLALEENPSWKADGMLDEGRALLKLKRAGEARKISDEASALQPQGHTRAGLRILAGDLFVTENDLQRAAAEYVNVVTLHDDADLKPLALHKLVLLKEQKKDTAEAEKYRAQLAKEFPQWKVPASATP